MYSDTIIPSEMVRNSFESWKVFLSICELLYIMLHLYSEFPIIFFSFYFVEINLNFP